MILCNVNNQEINVFEMKDIDALLAAIAQEKPQFVFKNEYDEEHGIRYRHYFLNYPISFDIETSSFYNDKERTVCLTNKEFEDEAQRVYDETYQKSIKKGLTPHKAKCKALSEQELFKEKYDKLATMYVWQMAFGTNNLVLVGRTWDEWVEALSYLKQAFGLDKNKEIIIYVHNLSYEMGFFKNNFSYYDYMLSDKVSYYAAIDRCAFYDPDMPRNVSMEDFSGFRFKDSLILSGVKEEKLPSLMNAKHANKHQKLVGSLDYDLIRHNKTPLSNDELAYCIEDVLLLNEYIQNKIEDNDDNIIHIAMTATGEIRRDCRNSLFYTNKDIKSKKDSKYIKYQKFMHKMRIDFPTYRQIRRAFQGGFTHANYINARKIWDDCIMSMDLASSYPAVMVCKKFPMSPYMKVEVGSKEVFNEYIATKSCLFDVVLYDLKPRFDEDTNTDFDLIENIISIHKADEFGRDYPDYAPVYPIANEEYYNNNGRLRHADEVSLTINEIDWEAICTFYDFDKSRVEVLNMRVADKDYLPKDLVLYILDLFYNKTKYKPFDGTDTWEGLMYKIAKKFINSVFGMTATDVLKESFQLEIDDDGNQVLVPRHQGMEGEALNKVLSDELAEKMENEMNFLCYQWSHVLTSHARMNLFKAIVASGTNHVYSDTDSEKFIKNEKTLKFREEYNHNIDVEMNACFRHYGIPENSHKVTYVDNETGKTVEKCLGYFELENKGQCYKKFVTNGAKRYLYQDAKGNHLTVAGLSKNAITYLEEKYGDKLYQKFAKGDIFVDRDHTGKMMATYMNNKTKGIVKDYKDNVQKFGEVCSVHLEKVEFDMHIPEYYEKLTEEGRIWEAV